MPNVNLLVVITVYNCVRGGVESVRPHQNVRFPGVPRQPQGQSLCNGLGAGGPATQGMAPRYS
jgi:hypothetical protein